MKGMRNAMGGGVDSLFNNSKAFSGLDDRARDLMQVHTIAIHRVHANELQPRKNFSEEGLQELAQSIEQYGIIQPLIVTPSKHAVGSYTLIAGERRYRAAKELGLEEIPVVIHDIEAKEAFILALTENIQRENLSPFEEAQAVFLLKEEFGFTQEELAKTLGKSRSTIANLLRVMNLSEKGKKALDTGEITLGHAKVLLGITESAVQDTLIEQIIAESLSVRQIEEILAQCNDSKEEKPKQRHSSSCPDYVKIIANRIGERFSTKIRIQGTEHKGNIVIQFTSREMLDTLLTVLEKE